jgi:sulfate transport system ATP-binding protein
MIEIKDLNLAFTKEYYALYRINLEVKQGEKVALLGDSESGKTTLLRVIAGLEQFESGQVLINGKNLKQVDFSTEVELGYVSYKPVFFNKKTVYENLYYVLKIRHIDEVNIAIKINEVLKEYEIEHLSHLKMKELSQFQKILVQLARISLRNIEIYLIDNIFENISEKEQEVLLKHIEKLVKTNATMLLATNKLALAKELCSRIVRLKFGSIEKEE